jgi:hypothetical protein
MPADLTVILRYRPGWITVGAGVGTRGVARHERAVLWSGSWAKERAQVVEPVEEVPHVR